LYQGQEPERDGDDQGDRGMKPCVPAHQPSAMIGVSRGGI
jgi:hypothetical protein